MRFEVNNNGFTPRLWGPGAWRLMHLVAAVYPVRPTAVDKAEAAKFFQSLAGVLPCPTCRAHYAAMVSSGPLKLSQAVLSSRMALFAWTVAIHDAVNRRIGKRGVGKSVAEWYKHYDSMR